MWLVSKFKVNKKYQLMEIISWAKWSIIVRVSVKKEKIYTVITKLLHPIFKTIVAIF